MITMQTIRDAGARAGIAATLALAGSGAMANGADPLDTTSLTETITDVGVKVGGVILALAAFAVTIWGATRLYSIFAGKGR